MMDFLIQSPNHDIVDAGMFLVSNLSHMEAPIRRAAMFTDVAEGLTDPKHPNYVAPENRNKDTVVYEHSIPASDMAYRVAYYKINNKWNNNFWDKYTVAVIPKKMEDVLKKNGLQSKSNPGFKFTDPNSSQYDRYYGPINYGEKAIVPIKNIFTGELTGEGISRMNKIIPMSEQFRFSKGIKPTVDLARLGGVKPRGITVLDFDDTLATTKSGVRARIPNPNGTPKPGRKVIFLAGGAGSGKSNVVKQLGLEGQGFKVVNSDISLEWLKKNSGLPADMRDLTKEQKSTLGKLQHQSRQIARNKMMKYKGNAEGVVVDGTGGSTKAMEKLVNEFKEKGYDVSMLFVETSLETALARNKARKERTLTDKIVTKNHEAVQGNKGSFMEMFGKTFMEVKTDRLKQDSPMPKDLVDKMNNCMFLEFGDRKN